MTSNTGTMTLIEGNKGITIRTLTLLALLWMRSDLGSAPAAVQTDETVSKPLIRALHLSAPAKRDLPAALEFIRESLPKEGVNTLVLEFDYGFNFGSRPEF